MDRPYKYHSNQELRKIHQEVEAEFDFRYKKELQQINGE